MENLELAVLYPPLQRPNPDPIVRRELERPRPNRPVNLLHQARKCGTTLLLAKGEALRDLRIESAAAGEAIFDERWEGDLARRDSVGRD